MQSQEIVFVSSHHPVNTYYAEKTRESFQKYTQLHNYGHYYDDSTPDETEMSALHFKRCVSLQKAAAHFPAAKWFVWTDSDVFVNPNHYHMKVEDQIDLSDDTVMYHLFHEAPWGAYPINTGVKFVNRNALKYEAEVWELRNSVPWPYEQKAIYECILPQIPKQCKIHDPYVLNCIIKAYPYHVHNALFVHMCASSEEERNTIMRNVYI